MQAEPRAALPAPPLCTMAVRFQASSAERARGAEEGVAVRESQAFKTRSACLTGGETEAGRGAVAGRGPRRELNV